MQRSENNGYLIVGGGASGLAAAVCAARRGKRVVVLERLSAPGKKLLATGNGRCNLLNVGTPQYEGGAVFAERVLSFCPASRVLDFFHSIGLATAQEADGRVYPACNQASAVLDVLRAACDRHGVRIVTDCRVTALKRVGGGFLAETDGMGQFAAEGALIAGGGMAAPRLGSDGSAYALLTALGHTLFTPLPALSPLETPHNKIRGLSGLRMPAILTLCEGDSPVAAAQGEMLVTDYGISGVCAMQLARAAQALKRPVLYVDLSPMLGIAPTRYARVPATNVRKNTQKALALLQKRQETLPDSLLTGLVPRLLAQKLAHYPIEALAEQLTAFSLPVTGVRGFEQAQVTQGGVDTRDFDAETMRSRLVPGLQAAGEVLDVDGDCGGYNLLFAWASGILAGTAYT